MEEFTECRPQADAVRALLRSTGLPDADLENGADVEFLGLRAGDDLVAVGGVEVFDGVALLRSVATDERWRGRGLAGRLVRRLEGMLLDRGIEEVFLLTTTAAPFFEKRGYLRTGRDEVPLAIRQTAEFTSLCPSSATVLMLALPRRDSL